MVQLVLSKHQTDSEFKYSAFVCLMNAYVSRADLEAQKTVSHSPLGGITLLCLDAKNSEVLLPSEDQHFLLESLKDLISSQLKHHPLDCGFIGRELAARVLTHFINIFCAYWAQSSVVSQAFSGNQEVKQGFDRIVTCIKAVLEILNFVSVYGPEEEATELRLSIATADECGLLCSVGSLLHKVKEMTDTLIKDQIYLPEIKFKQNVDAYKKTPAAEEIVELGPTQIDENPFGDFLVSIVSLACNLSFSKHADIE